MIVLRNYIPPLATLLVGAALFLVVGQYWPDDTSENLKALPAPEMGTITPSKADPSYEIPKPSDYSGLLAVVSERPLFSETRRRPGAILEEDSGDRRPKPADDGELDQQFEAPRITLHGFIRSDGKIQALISSPDSPSDSWVSLGNMIGNWEVVSVSEQSITLKRDSFIHVVEINR